MSAPDRGGWDGVVGIAALAIGYALTCPQVEFLRELDKNERKKTNGVRIS